MSEEQHGSEENGGIRINKFLASCGIDSRRVADRLIGEGRVEVNGKVIDTPGMRVTEKDFVKVDGRHMTPMEEVVVLLNKPRGYVAAAKRRSHRYCLRPAATAPAPSELCGTAGCRFRRSSDYDE